MKAIYILLACAVLMSTLNYISADASNHENSKIDDEEHTISNEDARKLLRLLLSNDSDEQSDEQVEKRMNYRYGRGLSYRYGKRSAMPYRFGKRSQSASDLNAQEILFDFLKSRHNIQKMSADRK